MISVQEAKNIVHEHSTVLPVVSLELDKALNHALAEDINSPIDSPPFNQSNVDGYAIAFREAGESLLISDRIPAGHPEPLSLQPGKAMRIFTGAPVPANADTVVMQEHVAIMHNRLRVQDGQLKQGSNFRPLGTDIRQGGLALHKGEYLTPAAIGFLAGLGISRVAVHKKPSIRIIITGNELQLPGKALRYGQVYEANSYMLGAALHQLGFTDMQMVHADDNLERLTAIMDAALQKTDLVILCGGISVGDFDFVLQAATACGVKKLFHKVKQRPGKPLYFGKKGSKLVLGLPGNPSSVLTCFYEYVVEALSLMSGIKTPVKVIHAPLAIEVKKPAGLSHFLKGFLGDHTVTALSAQESYRLSSFAKANCLIRLEENETVYEKGTVVEVHLLPGYG